LEFISSYKPQDIVFGIANVKSHGCIHTIGYYLGEDTLTLILPQSCYFCRNSHICTRQFGIQVIRKYNQKHKDAAIYFHF